MNERLEKLRRALADVGAIASVRGTGVAKFVFAELNGKAIEASFTGNGEWWIEFWDAGNNNKEELDAIDERTISDDNDAFRITAAWLSGFVTR